MLRPTEHKFTRNAVTGLMVITAMFSMAPRVWGQDKTEMPSPPEAITRFYNYLGSWEGGGTLLMNGETKNVTVKHTHSKISDGWGIQTLEEADIPGMGHYSAVDLFGFDPGKNLLHLFTVSNTGDTHDHMGKWINDNSFELRYDGIYEGKGMIETLKVTFDSPVQYHFTDKTTLEGKPYARFDVTMKKVK